MAWFKSLLFWSSKPAARERIEQDGAGSDSQEDKRLLASLQDRNPQVRCETIRSLEIEVSESSTRALVAALGDPESVVRATAAKTLGHRGDSSIMMELVPVLTDPCQETRAAAAGALRQLGWKPATQEEMARFEIALGNTRAAVRVGAAAVNPLVSELKQDTSIQRRAAAEALQELCDPGKIRPLMEALNDAEPSVRVSAIHALATESHELVTAELLKCFRDSDSNVRLAAAQVLTRRPDAPPAHFVPLLRDAHFELRLAAVQYLGRIAHPEITGHLVPMLNDSDSDVRQAVATALGNMRCAAAVEALVVMLADEEQLVRVAAEVALEQIDPCWASSEPAQHAVPQLQRLLSVRPSWVRSGILAALDKLGAVATG